MSYVWAAMNMARRLTGVPAAGILHTILVTRLREAESQAAQRYLRLVEALKTMLRPGVEERWVSVRRALRIVGLANVPSHDLMAAILELVPSAYMSRSSTPPRPRVIRGVKLQVSLEALRATAAKEWEERLRAEGLPPDPTPIAAEYRLGTPGPADHRRIAQLIRRVRERQAEASEYYSRADAYLFENHWNLHPAGHKRVWQLHCEGQPVKSIAAETERSTSDVQRIIDLHRSRCGLVNK